MSWKAPASQCLLDEKIQTGNILFKLVVNPSKRKMTLQSLLQQIKRERNETLKYLAL